MPIAQSAPIVRQIFDLALWIDFLRSNQKFGYLRAENFVLLNPLLGIAWTLYSIWTKKDNASKLGKRTDADSTCESRIREIALRNCKEKGVKKNWRCRFCSLSNGIILPGNIQVFSLLRRSFSKFHDSGDFFVTFCVADKK